MYCCSGCYARFAADICGRAFEHFKRGFADTFAGDVARIETFLAGLADLVDLVDVQEMPRWAASMSKSAAWSSSAAGFDVFAT